jgi:hypothetical protein
LKFIDISFSKSDVKNPKIDKKESLKEAQNLFDLAFTLIVQKDEPGYVEVFNGLSALFKGLIISNIIALLFILGYFFKELYIFYPYNEFNIFIVLNPIFLFLTLLFLLVIMHKRLMSLQHYFVISVYWNFMTWYKSKTVKFNLDK